MLNQINYILLDAARMGEIIEKAKEINPDFDSLYRGRSEESLASVAPFLFIFKQNTEFEKWYMENGWGDAWGILIRSHLPMPELHRHFRKFLIVGTEDNQELYFRFYDPRVLRIFLPTCNQQQLREFFGPIEYFIMEDEDKGLAIRCWLENGQLRSVKIPVHELIDNTFKFASAKTTRPVTKHESISEKTESEEKKYKPVQPAVQEKKEEDEVRNTEPARLKSETSKSKKETNDSKKGDSKWNNFFFD